MLDFYKGKKVLITGHTGFKGMWLSKILTYAGANVTGYSLEPNYEEASKVYNRLNINHEINSIIGDIRDLDKLDRVFKENSPEIVLHLAAQPLVIESYKNPVDTYSTNVMGTVNILECVRKSSTVKSVLNVTTDKVYENKEWVWGYRENESLNGYDPYSNSKSCSELVTHSYKKSFLLEKGIAISTARAGNVIGGGDYSDNRIIPDCIRAALKKEKIAIRNPHSTRPYQHVLEPLFAYLMIAYKQYLDDDYADWYNVGPDELDCVTTGRLVELFCNKWGENQSWENVSVEGFHEANFLKLDCSKIKNIFGWHPQWHIDTAVEKTIEWAKIYAQNGNVNQCMIDQIKDYYEGFRLIVK